MNFLTLSVFLTVTLTIGGPKTSVTAQQLPAFTTTIAAGHPLVSQIFDIRTGEAVSPDDLLAAMGNADFILLGEKHDNPDHHAIQSWAYDALLASGRKPALLYEMIGEDQQAVLDEFRQTGAGMDQLGDALDWDKSGWPDWAFYAPLAVSADRFGLPILGANLPRSLTRSIYSEGWEALGTKRGVNLDLNRNLPEAIEKAILDDVEAGHCGLMPREALGPMVMVQRVRDAVMADNLLRAGTPSEGAVLITGNGHARKDHGVPWAFRRTEPAFNLFSLGIFEVRDDLTTLAEYEEDYGGGLPYDFVIFTPRANDRDYCAELKATMSKQEK